MLLSSPVISTQMHSVCCAIKLGGRLAAQPWMSLLYYGQLTCPAPVLSCSPLRTSSDPGGELRGRDHDDGHDVACCSWMVIPREPLDVCRDMGSGTDPASWPPLQQHQCEDPG